MKGIVSTVRAAFDDGTTRSLVWRRRQLQRMIDLLEENEDELLAALRADLGKPSVEGYVTDIAFVLSELRMMIRNLEKWNATMRVRTPLASMPGRSRIVPEPLGVVLVIAAWNYPIQVLLVPAAGAIAAGNAVVMKPSEISSHTSALLARLVPQYMDSRAVTIVEGGVPETTELLRQRFDHIFYTGNGTVGRIVMTAAARHLTPVTLELGGKSPAIVDASANIAVSARRIAWGKWLNAGQTCIAPDYVLVERSRELALVEELTKCIGEFYGDDPATSDSYGRIVSDRHFDRLVGMIGEGTVATGGTSSRTDRYVAPTILTNVKLDGPLMTEEIFGPLLPIIPIDDVAAAVSFVRSRPHPLAMYIFAEDDSFIDRIVAETTAGGVTVNGTLLHLTNPRLPFGGVGDSGMGAYHGMTGVRTFQHLKPILSRGTRPDPRIAYPPYTKSKLRIIRRLL
jgi:aldehyde dehydrogenase (NAD+)